MSTKLAIIFSDIKIQHTVFALPFAVIFSLLLSVAPLLNFNSISIKDWVKKFVIISIVSAVIAFGGFWLLLEASLAFLFSCEQGAGKFPKHAIAMSTGRMPHLAFA